MRQQCRSFLRIIFLNTFSRPARGFARAAFVQKQSEGPQSRPLVPKRSKQRAAVHPTGRDIFVDILRLVEVQHPHPRRTTESFNAFRTSLYQQLLPKVLDKKAPWARLLASYVRQVSAPVPSVRLSGDPDVRFLVAFMRASHQLSPEEHVTRTHKLYRLMDFHRGNVSLDAILLLCSFANPNLTCMVRDDVRRMIKEYSKTKSKTSRHIRYTSQIYTYLVGASFALHDHEVVLQLYHEMRSLHIPVHTLRVFSHVIRSVFASFDLAESSITSGPMDERVVQDAVKNVQYVLDDLSPSKFPLTPHLIATLVRGFSRLSLSISKHRLSDDLQSSIFHALTEVRKTKDSAGAAAMIELAWADALLDIHEQNIQRRPFSSSSLGPETVPEFWKYDAVIARIDRRSWEDTRLPNPRPYTSNYYGHAVSRAVVESHRFQILSRDRLLFNDLSAALQYFLAICQIADSFEASAPRFLASLPFPEFPIMSPYTSSPSPPRILVEATSKDLRLRQHGTYQRLVAYALQSSASLKDESAAQHILDVLKHSFMFRTREPLMFGGVWKRTISALLKWRVPWDVGATELGIRDVLQALNHGARLIISSDVNATQEQNADAQWGRERKQVRAQFLSPGSQHHLLSTALLWVREREQEGSPWAESIQTLLETFHLFGITVPLTELNRLDAEVDRIRNATGDFARSVQRATRARDVFSGIVRVDDGGGDGARVVQKSQPRKGSSNNNTK